MPAQVLRTDLDTRTKERGTEGAVRGGRHKTGERNLQAKPTMQKRIACLEQKRCRWHNKGISAGRSKKCARKTAQRNHRWHTRRVESHGRRPRDVFTCTAFSASSRACWQRRSRPHPPSTRGTHASYRPPSPWRVHHASCWAHDAPGPCGFPGPSPHTHGRR